MAVAVGPRGAEANCMLFVLVVPVLFITVCWRRLPAVCREYRQLGAYLRGEGETVRIEWLSATTLPEIKRLRIWWAIRAGMLSVLVVVWAALGAALGGLVALLAAF